MGDRPVLNLPADNEGEMGEKKTGAIIFLYTVSQSIYLFYRQAAGSDQGHIWGRP